MEFPNLGQHCTDKTCGRLDFLPMKCDACSSIFCGDHIQYAKHSCPKSYTKDVQVPVCPLCNTPIPVPRGEAPDIHVGRHIDNACQSDPAKSRRKVFANRCSLKGCKAKEMVPIKCGDCEKNFCLKHRHPQDHKCSGPMTPADKARAAALNRLSQNVPSTQPQQAKPKRVETRPQASIAALQNGMSEDEALARALQASMGTTQFSQEQEDRMLAEALAQSEREARQQARTGNRSDRCILS